MQEAEEQEVEELREGEEQEVNRGAGSIEEVEEEEVERKAGRTEAVSGRWVLANFLEMRWLRPQEAVSFNAPLLQEVCERKLE